MYIQHSTHTHSVSIKPSYTQCHSCIFLIMQQKIPMAVLRFIKPEKMSSLYSSRYKDCIKQSAYKSVPTRKFQRQREKKYDQSLYFNFKYEVHKKNDKLTLVPKYKLVKQSALFCILTCTRAYTALHPVWSSSIFSILSLTYPLK